MKRLIQSAAFVFALLPLAVSAGTDIVKKRSSASVQETMDRIEAVVKEKGMTVFARIDHKANAASVRMSMNDAQVLIFGSPKAGTRIMLHDIMAGLDLPLKIYAYRDHDQKTWVVYRNPQSLKKHFNVEECVTIDKVEAGIGKLTDQALQ